jgi:HEAT repeat protein
VGALSDPDETVRRLAESALDHLELGHRGEVRRLARILDDPNPAVRRGALDGLAVLGPAAREAVPAMLKALRDGDARVRDSAVRALGKAGVRSRAAVVPPLSEALKDDDKSVRRAAARALAEDLPLNDADLPILLGMLRQSDVEIQVEAARGLKKLGASAKPAKSLLLAEMHQGNVDLRRAAIAALAEVGVGKDDVPVLEAALKDNDVEVRRHALEAASRLGPDARPLVPLVADAARQWRIRKPALETLARLGPVARDGQVMLILREALPEQTYFLQAADTISAIKPTGPEGKLVVPELVRLIEREPAPANAPARARVLTALGSTGFSNAWPELQKLLQDSRPSVRAAAATVLGTMGPDARSPDVLKRLTELEHDPSDEVRRAAADALKKISGK